MNLEKVIKSFSRHVLYGINAYCDVNCDMPTNGAHCLICKTSPEYMAWFKTYADRWEVLRSSNKIMGAEMADDLEQKYPSLVRPANKANWVEVRISVFPLT